MTHRWAWLLLVPLLAGGCKGCRLGKERAPREWECRSIAYHEVLDPAQGAGAAPFSIERLGRELTEHAVLLKPHGLTFTTETRVLVNWTWRYDYYGVKAIYSPEEEVARSVKDSDLVYPMKRFSDGKSERVRFGFRSKLCLKPEEIGSYDCTPADNELFLVADMTCEYNLRWGVTRTRTRKRPRAPKDW